MALEASLVEFRRRWRAEISGEPTAPAGPLSPKRRRSGESPEPAYQSREEGALRKCLPGSPAWDTEIAGCRFLQLAESLLDDGPVTTPGKEEKPSYHDRSSSLVEQLIHDLNDINEIPFFDIQLPYEIALKIFHYLGKQELGRCAQVSKAWKVLAEDEILWYHVCQMEGFLTDSKVTACTSWKEALKERRTQESLLRTNWKNRIGTVSQLHYELGKVLCDVHTSDGVVLAGYTSGDVRLWDTRTSGLAESFLETTHHLDHSAQSHQVSFVQINKSLAVAAYEDGSVDVWCIHARREPIHYYRHNQKIQALALCPETAAIATASSFEVKVESPDDRGYWRSSCIFHTQKLVNFLHLIHSSEGCPVAVAAAEEIVYLLKPEVPEKILHSTYGHTVTSLDVSLDQAAFGVKSYGWFSNNGNKIHVYNLQTGQCLTNLGNSAGDFSCINLKDSPPNLLVTGNRDRRVRVYDMRCSKSLCSFYAHHLGVSAVRMDDWKVVSGGEEGLICTWDQRMGTKLWEMHARHPVRYIWFSSQTLITANIPDEKNPRGASIMDDDLTAHRRHRGTINVHDFSVDQRSFESILPICRSSYNEVTGYNYNIGLAVPYDHV
ncbi:PREDICTED: F-box/WD repeat-containing protein 8 [Nanorana parkeri]|uniref:F-box/WD repeat-containing protein 8 n=1 Tax=Nanorana parkeri TaxID=125878 RepID=UPI000853FB46|nr:PREDICTED: F-box/WD repeat-containing protein 8 [Nanorana parkeri]